MLGRSTRTGRPRSATRPRTWTPARPRRGTASGRWPRGQRYWDGERWTTHRRPKRPPQPCGVRRRWGALPVALQVGLPILLVVVLAGAGWALFSNPPRDDWAGLPNRLNCQNQDGPKPPEGLTMSGVEVKHHHGSLRVPGVPRLGSSAPLVSSTGNRCASGR
ncbi:MAG: DUF2510 domain-containing protein [Mycobacteriaceae bacterium]|nr:DUF2510 domain-containing protein [Mycobacteriaceae bacterium]